MNSIQAKQLSLPDIMSRLGYEPARIVRQGREVWYNSPFRKEKDASFHTSFLGNQWTWNDFGDTGGTVIDFVMRHENYGNVKDALAFLDRMFPGYTFDKPVGRVGDKPVAQTDLFSFQQQRSAAASSFNESPVDRQLEFIKAYPIQSQFIFDYLKGRGIPKDLANQYLQEVKYRNLKSGKEYFAFAMLNESGGYEIRVASDQYAFKSALIARDITLVKGTSGNADAVNIFEGMADFLSLLVLLNTRRLAGDAIIMHSLSSFERTTDAIHRNGYKKIRFFVISCG